MSTISISRTIAAPLPLVFSTISDIRNFSKAVPEIVKVEFLGDKRSGVGTRFRETRQMKGREATTVLKVTEFTENEHIRLVADAAGTEWDSVFRVEDAGEGATHLTLQMEARPYKLLSRIFTPLMKGMIRKPLENDMDAVKAWCEEQG